MYWITLHKVYWWNDLLWSLQWFSTATRNFWSPHPHPTVFQPQDWHYPRSSYPRGHGMVASSSWGLVCLHLYAVESSGWNPQALSYMKPLSRIPYQALSLNALKWLSPVHQWASHHHVVKLNTSGMLFLGAQKCMREQNKYLIKLTGC